MMAADRVGGGRRLFAGSIIIVVHLALLALLMTRRAPAISDRAVAAMTVRAVPATPVPPMPEAPLAVDLAAPALDAAEPEVAQGAACRIAETVATALASDAATVAALTPLATEPTRAIMVWDGAWSAQPAADPIRRTVVATVATASRSCRDEPMVGPRLMFVPIAGTTISVAVGSGSWSWQALLSDDPMINQLKQQVPMLGK